MHPCIPVAASLGLALACAQSAPGAPAPTAREIDAALRDPAATTVPGTRPTRGTLHASQGWYDDPEPDREALREELREAHQQVEETELRVEEADARYSRAKHNHFRGTVKSEVLAERAAAKKAHAEALARYDEVKARANRWGVYE
jgi:hypothetical protein